MVSDLLERQMIERRRPAEELRRRRSRAVVARQSVLDRQERARTDWAGMERLGASVRIAVLVAAIGALVAGLVMVGLDSSAADSLAADVVADDVQRAAVAPPQAGGASDGLPGEGEEAAEARTPGAGTAQMRALPPVGFERTEDYEYVVAEGDTLSGIAADFDLTFRLLADYNDLDDADELVPGQRIIIPGDDILPGAER